MPMPLPMHMHMHMGHGTARLVGALPAERDRVAAEVLDERAAAAGGDVPRVGR